ncbi:MAG: polyprenyl synthetase family protein, partial [Thermoanaerobaculia bacterium]|nr:polyprenyl synthetase family protein [Thermoanaerobaculia bacterium]
WLASRRERIDLALDRHLPPPDTPPAVIHDAMRYSVLAGGKRIRPLLAIAAAEACGASTDDLVRPFCALELIHTYSLVHDDLPALDDDELRRGRKTSHVVYGEAIAVLVGDALLTEAFSWLSKPIESVEPSRQLEAIRIVSRAIDSKGMIGGQVADLEAENLAEAGLSGENLLERLEFIHRNKTGQLLTASILLGGLLAGADQRTIDALRTYGEAVGLAFQIVDDLLDLEGTSESLGKTAGKDLEQGKLTYPSLIGVEAARARAEELQEIAVRSADMIGSSQNFLGPIARYIGSRSS